MENWTKWQVYVRQSPEDDTPVVVYAQTSDTVAFQNKVSIVWREQKFEFPKYIYINGNSLLKNIQFSPTLSNPHIYIFREHQATNMNIFPEQ